VWYKVPIVCSKVRIARNELAILTFFFSELNVYILQFWLFNTQLGDIKLELHDIKSQLLIIKSEFKLAIACYKVRIVRYKLAILNKKLGLFPYNWTLLLIYISQLWENMSELRDINSHLSAIKSELWDINLQLQDKKSQSWKKCFILGRKRASIQTCKTYPLPWKTKEI